MRQKTRPNNYFFVVLLIIFSALTLWMFLPFLSPLVFAMTLAVIFYPFNRWLAKKLFRGKKRSNIAAVLTLLCILVIVILPLTLVVGKIYLEVMQMYQFVVDQGGSKQVFAFIDQIEEFFSLNLPDQSIKTLKSTGIWGDLLKWLISNLSKIFSNLMRFATSIFVMILGLFYFLRDGQVIRQQIIAFSPLEDKEDENLVTKVQQSIYSIFLGSLVIALIQGMLTGIGLTIFQVPSPVLWGSVAALTSLIPGIGTSLVLIPAVIYLVFTKTFLMASGLLVWGILFIGLSDNFLRPILMGPNLQVPPFLIFLSVIGGLFLYGPVGIVLGPLVLALLFALLTKNIEV